MVEFKRGDRIPILDGSEAEVLGDKPLGSGGQGEVYKVLYKGKEYALKWYTASSIRDMAKEFSKNIQNNIDRGSPGDGFLWPKHLTEIQKENNGFGYLMDLIPSNYSSFSDILRTYKVDVAADGTGVRVPVGFKSLDTMVLSAHKMVAAFRSLQRAGLSYQDLNDGGFYIDTVTGDVLICDCDNVAPSGENFGIKGKPGYMAPEVVTNTKKPDRNTDKHSLSVVLFKLLMRGDPLEGSKVCSCVVLTGSKELEFYGTDPLFIYDENDTSNMPVKGIHSNVIKNWPLFPDYVRDTFKTAFGPGLKNPSSRPIPDDWFKILSRLRMDIVSCVCGRQSFFSTTDDGSDMHTCSRCGRQHHVMEIGGNPIVLAEGKEIHPGDIDAGNEDYGTVIGRVIENRKVQGVFGVKNLSNYSWTASYADGTIKEVQSGGGAPITDGMTLKFGTGGNNLIKVPEGKTRR